MSFYDDSYLISLSGLKDSEGHLIPKEIAIISFDHDYIGHWIISPPCWEFHLIPSVRRKNTWLKEHVHGLDWKMSGVSYEWIIEFLSDLGTRATKIFVYGCDNIDFLQSLILNTEIEDITNNIPMLPTLPETPYHCYFYGQVKREKLRCTLNIVHRIKNWLKIEGENKIGSTEYVDMTGSVTTLAKRPAAVIYDTPRLLSITENNTRVREADSLDSLLDNDVKTRLVLRSNSTPKKRKGRLGKLGRILSTMMVILLLPATSAIIGYDCGSESVNVTTLSLLDVGECEISPPKLNISTIHIRLLQLGDYTQVKVIQCKVFVKRTVFYCGIHSHNSIVQGGELGYLTTMSEAKCKLMQEDGIYTRGSTVVIDKLKRNSSRTEAFTIAGTNDNVGTCKGTYYADDYGNWNNVVVEGYITITLQEYYASVDIDKNRIHLRSGTS